jgi:hypothetical protein
VVKQFLNRLNPLHNWPLLVTILVFVVSVGLVATRFSLIKNLEAPKFGETIAYWSRVADPFLYKLVTNFIWVWPVIILLSLFVLAIQTLPRYSQNQALGCFLFIFSNLFGCIVFSMSILQPDGHKLSHVQSVSKSDHVYHLTLDNVQGGGADYFYSIYFVFKCDADGKLCHMIQSTTNKYDFGGNPPPASLNIAPDDNALYLQIGDEKTLIVQ